MHCSTTAELYDCWAATALLTVLVCAPLQPLHTGPLPPPSLAEALAALSDPSDLGSLQVEFARPPPQAWLTRLQPNQLLLLLFSGDDLQTPLGLCKFLRLNVPGQQLAGPACAVVKLLKLYGLPGGRPYIYDEWLARGSESWVPLSNSRLLPLPPDYQPHSGAAQQSAAGATTVMPQPLAPQPPVPQPAAQPQQQQSQVQRQDPNPSQQQQHQRQLHHGSQHSNGITG